MSKSRCVVQVGLSIQILAPLFLLIDLLRQWYFERISVVQTVVISGCLIWVAWTLVYFVRYRRRDTVPDGIRKFLLTFYASMFGLVAIECGLRLIQAYTTLLPPNDSYYRPNLVSIHHTDPAITPGISGDGNFTVNEAGLRGPSLNTLAGHGRVYRIVTVGGSTTACTLLDDAQAWPQLVMDRLNEGQNRIYAFVGNTGVDGHTSVESMFLLRTRSRLRDTDAYIFLLGVNDLTAAIGFEGKPTQQYLESRCANMGFEANSSHLWYSRLELYRTFSMIQSGPRSRRVRVFTPPHDLELYVRGRALRQKGPVLPLPDLTNSLEEYETRIQSFAGFCREERRRCVFLTQPSLWRAGLAAAEEKLLWLGAIDSMEAPRGFVSAAELGHAMDVFNQGLLHVCRGDGLECYDLASAIPKSGAFFFDDVHFNEAGSRLVARFVAEQLLKVPPFSSQGSP